MAKFRLSRTVEQYEHCIIEAESFDAALESWIEDPSAYDGRWEDSQLGEDEVLTAIALLDEKGEVVEDRDVTLDGKFEDN